MLNGVAYCVMQYDAQGRPVDFLYLDVNAAFERLTGLKNVVGKMVSEVIPGIREVSPELFETYDRVSTTGKPETFEFDFKSQNQVLNISVYSPERGHFVALFEDITARKRAEVKIQRKNLQLRLQINALNAAADAIVITDREGVIEWANPAFTTLTGYSSEEAVGRNPRDLLRSGLHDSSFYKGLWDTVLDGRIWSGELTNRRKDGSLYAEEQTITPLKDEQGAIANFIAIKRDVTAKKELEAQFLQAQKMESVGRLAGGIAHDFNNILTIINGTAEIALADRPPGDSVRTDLAHIHQAGQRAASLTRQLLAFSRKQILKREVLSMNTVVNGLENMLKRLLGADISLVCTLSQSLGLVRVDPGQLEQVLMNLCVNARDAMPTGGRLTIETHDAHLDDTHAATHHEIVPGPHVLLAVSDTGMGMDKETQARLFEPFFTTKELGRGTGLGLSTVYGIVKQSGGTIWVYSEVGKGTTFKVYLPRVDIVPEPLQPVRLAARGESTGTIVIVEDDEALLQLSARILERAGYTVLTASTGARALELLATHQDPIHLVFTDVVLPGLSGPGLAAQIAQRHPETKVLYTSGYTDDAVLRHGVLDGQIQFISKPYSRTELTTKIQEVLDLPV